MKLSQQELVNYKSRSTITKIEADENEFLDTKNHQFAGMLDIMINYIKTGIISKILSIRIEKGRVTILSC